MTMRAFPKLSLVALALASALLLQSWGPGPQAQTPAAAPQPPSSRKKLLALGDTRTGFTHDSIGHALAVIERLGYESGLFDTYIRTDSQWITKQPVPAPARNARNLDFFDAVFLFISGEGDWSDQQKKDFVAFVKDDGKGVVAAHTGNAAFYEWSEYGEMLGGYFDNHPWNVVTGKVILDAPDFPAMKHFPNPYVVKEEFYALRAKPYSRDKVRVLAHLDPSSVDMNDPDIHRTDADFPVAMARNYGKGRTFWSAFGHAPEAWDNPVVQTMYLEAIKWSMGLTPGDATPSSIRKPTVEAKRP